MFCLFTIYFDMAESIGRLLECSICLEQMVLPKILPCFHTFCLACLCKIESKENKLQCPECRKVHNLPNDGAKGFNNNWKLRNFHPHLFNPGVHPGGPPWASTLGVHSRVPSQGSTLGVKPGCERASSGKWSLETFHPLSELMD